MLTSRTSGSSLCAFRAGGQGSWEPTRKLRRGACFPAWSTAGASLRPRGWHQASARSTRCSAPRGSVTSDRSLKPSTCFSIPDWHLNFHCLRISSKLWPRLRQ
ncbi:unnamed protein product [Symbiodinium necroappetens]|uniref:Uncharacterized protein n=1 Tax=Symbiodinium necroappetens TaxID=1628268 RepID=A0A812XHS8_9DINO|nr:unnamed protein product [Symbiodinium necroappetens]